MAALKYWIWLTTRQGVGAAAVRRMLERFGTPEEAYLADTKAYTKVEGLRSDEIAGLRDKSMRLPEQIIETCDRLGYWIMTCQDAGYPIRLLNIYNPPFVLYGRGKRILFDEEAAVGIVGARECSPYGIKIAGTLGYELARQGMLVVSGLARGIDTAAVQGALRAKAPAVGVLGCGLDVVYPPENRALYEDVARHGLLLSEFPPGTRPLPRHFPVRNRIISGLSLGVVIVEGGKASGSLITARHALEQGRDVFAVPGNIDAPMSVAPNRLLREGAIPLLNGEDVAREYIHLYPHRIKSPGAQDAPGRAVQKEAGAAPPADVPEKKEVDKSKPKAYIDLQEHLKEFTDDELAAMRALGDKKLHVDEIIEVTGLPAGRILSALTVLQLRELVEQHPGKFFEACMLLKE